MEFSLSFVLSEISIKTEDFIFFGRHDTSFLIFGHSLFEEVCLALDADHVHPFEGILAIVEFRDIKREEQSVSNELEVLLHHL